MLFIAVVASPSFVVAVGRTDDLARQAESAYAKGDFKGAADLYQELIDQGVKRSEVYFDLGNAYYQLHDLGWALVNYRRAEIFTPRDEYLRLNLARIRAQRIDGTIAERGIFGQIVGLTSDWLSLSELSWIIIALWWFCCGFTLAYMWRTDWRKWLRRIILFCSALFILTGLLVFTRAFVDSSWKPAIIVRDAVSVMSGPGTNYLAIFELHTAAEIRILEVRNHWVRLQLPDLRQGWIEAQSLEMI